MIAGSERVHLPQRRARLPSFSDRQRRQPQRPPGRLQVSLLQVSLLQVSLLQVVLFLLKVILVL